MWGKCEGSKRVSHADGGGGGGYSRTVTISAKVLRQECIWNEEKATEARKRDEVGVR